MKTSAADSSGRGPQAPAVTNTGEPILLFDGICNLCERSVQFVIRRDKHRRFRFAALQSQFAQDLVGPEAGKLDSVVLVVNGQVYRKSGAALQTARRLNWPWPLAAVFLTIPRFLRDAVYDWIGGNRYRWFGKKSECWVPTTELRDRFLD